MVKLRPEQTPDEADSLLRERCGIGLFRFAQVFAVSPIDFVIQKRNEPFNYREITEVRRVLNRLKQDILNAARKIDNLMSRAGDLPHKGVSEEELLKEGALRKFWIEYILPHEAILFYFERTRQLAKKGSGLGKTSIIAVGWGNLIARAGHRIDWKLLGDLYYWFWERMGKYKYYREWSPSDGIEDYLKIQYHRYRFKGSLDEFVLEKLPLAGEGHEKEDLRFMMKLITYKWADGKLSDKEISSLLLNIFLDWYLAANEGLTILAPLASYADPSFGYLYFWLRKKVSSDLLRTPDEIKGFDERLFADRRAPFQDSYLGSFFQYAADIYLARNKDLKLLPPMIIFPDRSYYPRDL